MTNNKDSDSYNSSGYTESTPATYQNKTVQAPEDGHSICTTSCSKSTISSLGWNLISPVKNGLRADSPEVPSGRKQQTRFNVALLGLAIAVVNCYAQATFCISIVEMVLPADYNLIVQQQQSNQTNPNSSSSQNNYKHRPEVNLDDSSCPLDQKYRDYYDDWRFQTSSINNVTSRDSTSLIDVSNRFNWDASQQGLLLGAFAIGTAPLQVIGGRLAEIYGAKWVLLAGCIGSGLTNLTIPFIAHFNLMLLILNRILMGVAQAGMEPGLMCLLAKWLTPAETGYYISMLLFAICIGFFLGSLCSSFILSIGYGWPLTFYVSGSMNLLVGLIWFIYASSTPEESKIISRQEFVYIKSEQEKVVIGSKQKIDLVDTHCDINDKKICPNLSSLSPPAPPPIPIQIPVSLPVDGNRANAPWRNILSTPSVWAFIICKFSIRWCVDVLTLELPIYLANVLHLSIKLNGILNSTSSALFAIFSFLSGYFADMVLISQQRRLEHNLTIGETDRKYKFIISKTNFRKLVQSIASFGSALSVFLMTKYDCNILLSMTMMLVLSCLLVLGTGGELQIPYDMTSSYPGTLHGMACTMSVSGWLAPPLIGLILADQPTSRYRWSLVWYLTAFINLLGGLVFVLFADASPRNFDSRKPTSGSQGAREVGGLEGGANLCSHQEPQLAQAGRSPGKEGASSASRKQLDWSPLFDRELIKVRQLEESYIERPSYLADFDSIFLDRDSIIFPYRADKNDSLSSSGQLLSVEPEDSTSFLRRLLSRLSGGFFFAPEVVNWPVEKSSRNSFRAARTTPIDTSSASNLFCSEPVSTIAGTNRRQPKLSTKETKDSVGLSNTITHL